MRFENVHVSFESLKTWTSRRMHPCVQAHRVQPLQPVCRLCRCHSITCAVDHHLAIVQPMFQLQPQAVQRVPCL